MALQAARALNLPAQLILECATGVEGWDTIGSRYGFSSEDWKRIQEWPPFVADVENKRLELQRAGVPFRLKAGYMAEDLLEDVYVRIKSPDVSVLQKLEGLKLIAKLADYEPKPNQNALAAGSGFSIHISIPGSSQPQPVTVDVQPTEAMFQPVETVVPETPPVEEIPEPLPVPQLATPTIALSDFSINFDFDPDPILDNTAPVIVQKPVKKPVKKTVKKK